jgi:hypothetical protein
MADHGMPFARVGTISKSRNFSNPPVRHQVRRDDTLQFRTLEGTSRMAGVSDNRPRRLIAKEVTDNALDDTDRIGAPGMVTIERDGRAVFDRARDALEGQQALREDEDDQLAQSNKSNFSKHTNRGSITCVCRR